MSARRKKKGRKRGRKSNKLDENIMDQLRGMGFTTQQIEDVAQDVDESKEDQFDTALELLLANQAINENNNGNHNNNNNNNGNIINEPPRKRRRVDIDISMDQDDDDDDDDDDNNNDTNDDNNNNTSSEEEKKSQSDEIRKKTHVEIKEEEFNKRKEEMELKESEYKKWLERETKFEESIIEIRDNINNLYNKMPELPNNNNNNINKENAKIDDLLTERIQLYGIIEYAQEAMKKHLKFCNEKVDAQFMKKEIKKQEIENKKIEFEQSIQEFESEKYALKLMQSEVKTGQNVMTLVEHNLFIVASAMNNIEEHVDNTHFKDLSDKIKILQNKHDQQEEKEENKVEFECEICFCPYSELSEILIFDECYHYYCINCLQSTLKVKLQDRNVKDVKCPHEKCEHKLTHQEISYILTKEEFAKFDEYLLDKTLQSAKDCRFCPGIDCGAAMFGYSDSPMLTCPKCTKQFCFNCGTEEWHQGVTCHAFKKWKEENGKADVKFDEWVKNQNAKQCPNCNSFIEKNGGCDHMTYVLFTNLNILTDHIIYNIYIYTRCQSCKYEFHWVTMEKWRGYGARYNLPANHNRNRNNNNNRRGRERARGRGRGRRRGRR